MASSPQAGTISAVEGFVGGDPGRSLAVESLRGVEVRAAAQEDEVRPAASLLKLALVAAVHEAAERGELDLRARIRRSGLPPTSNGSVLDALSPEHELSLGELCAFSLVTSDNPAAEYLVRLVGPGSVNRLLEGLGLERTRLRAGFSDEEIAGRANTTTAREALLLVRRLIAERERIAAILESNLRNGRIPLRLPEGTRVLHKSGTLSGVANDAGVVYGARTDLAFAFLCEGQPDPARTSVAIGDCVAEVRVAAGEPVLLPVGSGSLPRRGLAIAGPQ
jgi:beta-lactamase class A